MYNFPVSYVLFLLGAVECDGEDGLWHCLLVFSFTGRDRAQWQRRLTGVVFPGVLSLELPLQLISLFLFFLNMFVWWFDSSKFMYFDSFFFWNRNFGMFLVWRSSERRCTIWDTHSHTFGMMLFGLSFIWPVIWSFVKISDFSNADVAVDQYHPYTSSLTRNVCSKWIPRIVLGMSDWIGNPKQEDIQLMKDMGMDAYRFSIAWSCIFFQVRHLCVACIIYFTYINAQCVDLLLVELSLCFC